MNNIIKNAGFHHIALKANDFEKSFKFYQDLGFTVKAIWGPADARVAMLDMGNGTLIELFAGGTDQPALGRYFHLAIATEDVDGAYAAAISAGAKSKSEPRDATIAADGGDMNIRLAFVFGPDGEELEFFFEK